jgi:Ala-tRNA(Pro) deacylase
MFDEDALYRWLAAEDAPYEVVEHPPIHTVAEGEALRADMPGGHSKSLLLNDKSGALFLVTALGRLRADLRHVGRALGAGRLSFADEEELYAVLGLRPGSVTPLALPRDGDRRIVRVVLDTNLMAHDRVWCHPLRNTASIALPPAVLERFVTATHGAPLRLDVTGGA